MLDEAYWWYELQLQGLGERLLDEVELCFEKLKHTPFYYSFLDGNCRQLILRHFPYKIIFEIIANDVIIYAIFQSSRDPDKIFE